MCKKTGKTNRNVCPLKTRWARLNTVSSKQARFSVRIYWEHQMLFLLSSFLEGPVDPFNFESICQLGWGTWHYPREVLTTHQKYNSNMNTEILIHFIIPFIISKASSWDRVILSCFQDDGLLDSMCFTNKWDARTFSLSLSPGLSHRLSFVRLLK